MLTALRFRGPDTDLRVGLLESARWLSATSRTSWGQEHVVNLPTEEVFTTPDRRLAEGTVRLTAPLYWYGSLVEGGRLRFSGGEVVEASADRGEGFLRSKLATDPGACRLGEVALVDVDSAVGRRGLLFRNGLFDENASSHVAIGTGYTEPVDGADTMDDEERLEAGINVSTIHIDLDDRRSRRRRGRHRVGRGGRAAPAAGPLGPRLAHRLENSLPRRRAHGDCGHGRRTGPHLDRDLVASEPGGDTYRIPLQQKPCESRPGIGVD